MQFLIKQSTALRANPWGLAPYVCALLGFLWALNPSVHGVFHLAGLGHHHPSYSVYSHSQAGDLGLGIEEQAASFDQERSASRETDADDSSGAEGNAAGERREKKPAGPIDEGSGGIFLSLEIESTSSVAIEAALSESLLPPELAACEEFECFYPTWVGASVPRGPPA